MSDRFEGTIRIGGKITKEQKREIDDLLSEGIPCRCDHDLVDFYFYDCVSGDMEQLIQYCESESIPLWIQWDAKYEFDAYLEIYMDGKRYCYDCNNSGDIPVSLAWIESKIKERPDIKGSELVALMNVVSFPDLEIEDENAIDS